MDDMEIAKDKIRRTIRNLDNMNTLMHDAEDDETFKKCKWELLWFLKSGRSFYPLMRNEFDTEEEAVKYGSNCLDAGKKMPWNTIKDLEPEKVFYSALHRFLPIPVKAAT